MIFKFISWLNAHILILAYLLSGSLTTLMAWWRFGARIYARERAFKIFSPFALYGRPDLIMQNWGGGLVVHDLKTRSTARVYDSDLLQLNLYAFLLREATGRRVENYAYVRVLVKNKLNVLRVDLKMSSSDLCGLASRYHDAVQHPETAKLTRQPWLCKNCGFNGKGCSGLKSRG